MRYGDCHKPTMELANFYLKVRNNNDNNEIILMIIKLG